MKITVKAPCAGSIWLQMMSVGQKVSIGEVLLIQESMKLELTIESTDNGKIIWLASAGTSVQADDPVAIIETGE